MKILKNSWRFPQILEDSQWFSGILKDYKRFSGMPICSEGTQEPKTARGFWAKGFFWVNGEEGILKDSWEFPGIISHFQGFSGITWDA